MRRRQLLIVVATVLLLAVVVAGGLARVVTRGGTPPLAAPGTAAAGRFLDGYVEPDGRVVRRDQGGDTVSEGQAYALLVATAVGDEETVETVWSWTRAHLQRPDGLLSWQWRDGEVVDPESATDADLDAARALVVAGERFGREDWVADGTRLGRAVLAHESVVTGGGRVLVAGTWVDSPPYEVNPSYASPVATAVLGRATGDARFAELREGDAALVESLVRPDRLPPDWAEVERDGTVRPTGGPSGEPLRFGYDAGRVPVRYAESCQPELRALAAEQVDLLARAEPPRAVYDLDGSPQIGDSHPLAHVALAAAAAADGRTAAAHAGLDAADAALEASPTYYGAAWAALGRILLTDDVLGGCPPLAAAP